MCATSAGRPEEYCSAVQNVCSRQVYFIFTYFDLSIFPEFQNIGRSYKMWTPKKNYNIWKLNIICDYANAKKNTGLFKKMCWVQNALYFLKKILCFFSEIRKRCKLPLSTLQARIFRHKHLKWNKSYFEQSMINSRRFELSLLSNEVRSVKRE